MKLVFKNIKNLIRKQIRFAALIVLTMTMGTFAVMFSVSVLYNNQYVLMEDSNSTMSLGIYFTAEDEKIVYENVQKTLEKVYKLFNGSIVSVGLEHFQYGEDVVTFMSHGGWDGESYTFNDSYGQLDYQIYEGRNLTEEDYSNKNCAAVVSGSYKGDTVQVYGKDFDIVGRRLKDDTFLPVVWIPISCWENIPVHYVKLKFSRIPTQAEYDKVCMILETDFMGEVEISDYYAGSADFLALYRSLGIAVGGILFSVIGTLLMLYGYVYETRQYSLTVMKLSGCKNMQAAGIYILENMLIALPACAAGALLFAAARYLWLDRIYLYIKGIFDVKMYLICMGAVLTAVFFEAVVMAVLSTRGSVKDQLRGDKG